MPLNLSIQTEIVLPLALVVLNLCLKLFVGRSVQFFHIVETLIELPRDLAFQGTLFIVAFTISSPLNISSGLVFFVIYIIWLVVSTFIYRLVNDYYTLHRDRLLITIVSFALPLGLSVVCLLFAIQVLIGGEIFGL